MSNVVTVEAERTFWDKIIILHGLLQWFDRRGVLRHGGQRASRHYYDVHDLRRCALAPATKLPAQELEAFAWNVVAAVAGQKRTL